MQKTFLSLLLAFAGFAHAADMPHFWCNERFLRPEAHPFDARHLRIAKRGYLYAMAAALALQKNNREGRAYHFALPARMREIDRPSRDISGFEAATFEIHAADATQGLQEIVIAFTGSNDETDWKETNFGTDQRQYLLARRYLKKIAARPEYQGVRKVVTGFSLGGALAVHVTKHVETSALVHETWAFNPSPKTWVSGRPDARIWLAAVEHEALHYARHNPLLSVLPGVAEIGAPSSQTAEDFYLLEANPVYSHFRWVLTRNLLHVADLAIQNEQTAHATSEPLEILRSSHFSSCKRNS